MSETSLPAEWARDLVQAASDLGYGVERIEHSAVELLAVRDRRDISITVETHFLSGDLLRAVLLAQADPEAGE